MDVAFVHAEDCRAQKAGRKPRTVYYAGAFGNAVLREQSGEKRREHQPAYDESRSDAHLAEDIETPRAKDEHCHRYEEGYSQRDVPEDLLVQKAGCGCAGDDVEIDGGEVYFAPDEFCLHIRHAVIYCGHGKLNGYEKTRRKRRCVLRVRRGGKQHKHHKYQRKNRSCRVRRGIDKFFERSVVHELILRVQSFEFVGVFGCSERRRKFHRDIVKQKRSYGKRYGGVKQSKKAKKGERRLNGRRADLRAFCGLSARFEQKFLKTLAILIIY